MIFPVAVFVLAAFFLALPVTRRSTLWLLEENHPVEMLTFIFLLAGGLRGAILAWRAYRHGEAKLCIWFYLVFAAGLLLTAMEEIAWGQKFLDFETPSAWKELNAQGETTLHNLRAMGAHNSVFRLVFGLGGLIGVWLIRFPSLRKIAVPPILLSWFWVITAHSIVDLFNDFVPIEKDFDLGIHWLSELVEMLIGMASFLYTYLHGRMPAAAARPIDVISPPRRES